jgi:hypothetical protein
VQKDLKIFKHDTLRTEVGGIGGLAVLKLSNNSLLQAVGLSILAGSIIKEALIVSDHISKHSNILKEQLTIINSISNIDNILSLIETFYEMNEDKLLYLKCLFLE